MPIYRAVIRGLPSDESGKYIDKDIWQYLQITKSNPRHFGHWVNKELDECGIRSPKRTNPKARFYFTERGWNTCGRKLVEMLENEGFAIKVSRKDNPKASQIAYKDAYQVAIYPERGD